jgi:transcriptional regulator with XRE-family HTH domain
MTRKEFGPTVKRLRLARGLSQKDLAEAVGIDFGYLSNIERSKVNPPSRNVVLRIARELAVDKDELLVLARRVPSDIEPIITQAPYIPRVLRRAKGLNKRDWSKIEEFIQELKNKGEEKEQ